MTEPTDNTVVSSFAEFWRQQVLDNERPEYAASKLSEALPSQGLRYQKIYTESRNHSNIMMTTPDKKRATVQSLIGAMFYNKVIPRDQWSTSSGPRVMRLPTGMMTARNIKEFPTDSTNSAETPSLYALPVGVRVISLFHTGDQEMQVNLRNGDMPNQDPELSRWVLCDDTRFCLCKDHWTGIRLRAIEAIRTADSTGQSFGTDRPLFGPGWTHQFGIVNVKSNCFIDSTNKDYQVQWIGSHDNETGEFHVNPGLTPLNEASNNVDSATDAQNSLDSATTLVDSNGQFWHNDLHFHVQQTFKRAKSESTYLVSNNDGTKKFDTLTADHVLFDFVLTMDFLSSKPDLEARLFNLLPESARTQVQKFRDSEEYRTCDPSQLNYQLWSSICSSTSD